MRKFMHDGESWEVDTVGLNHGIAIGDAFRMKHQVVIVREKDGSEYRGWIFASNLERATDEELRAALERVRARARST